MQRHPDGSVVVSATDLVGFLECDHLATLELGKVQGLWDKPHHRKDPELELLRERGIEHEQRFLERQRATGQTIVDLLIRADLERTAALEAAQAATLAAMRSGADVIYQATLFDGRWVGYADFLLRVERPSALGSWSYEVADTKLARAVKGGALLQVCVYSDLLERLQGFAPEHVHVVTGDGVTHTERLDDYAAFYRSVKRRFEAEVFGDCRPRPRDAATAGTYPDPVDHCRVCTWYPICADRRRADDHLSIVAGMSRAATERLIEADVPTRRSLATLAPDAQGREGQPADADALARAGARPGRGRGRHASCSTSSSSPTPSSPTRASPDCPSRRRSTSSSTSRPTRGPSRTNSASASSTSSGW